LHRPGREIVTGQIAVLSVPLLQSLSFEVAADAQCQGLAPSTSSSNVDLSLASGITSRRLGFIAGGLFALLAFSPLLKTVFVTMPSPVKGAVLV